MEQKQSVLSKKLAVKSKTKKTQYHLPHSFDIEKELLLSLMGIETNFGTYVGKMDILSSLATLSFDKRRSEFFTNELLILLRLIENEQIDYKTLYGSWAGAFGFFQFMPSTMKNYAIDHDGNGYIDLKNNKLTNNWRLQPKKNMIVFFPSYLHHRIEKNTFDEVRHSLAFNIMPDGTTGVVDSEFVY